MSALLPGLVRQIRAGGPLSIAAYMHECLLNPQYGYYPTRDPFGAGGDFTTAPEISQMYGEMLGLCIAQAWLDQGAPTAFILAEPGPGRGTLMADILRATRGVAGFHQAAQLHLIEVSPILREVQRKTLAGYDIAWHRQISDLPSGPLFLVANEFFDALPIRQFIRTGAGWRERRIGESNGKLHFGASDATPLAALAPRIADTGEGDIVEICAPAAAIAAEIALRIAAAGGLALIIDYGGWRSKGDTFQALRNHGFADVLADPGEADLTAHVDFEPLARAGSHAALAVSALTPQGVLLEALGITARARTLAAALTGKALENHIAAHRRLTHPEEMGTLFKALALYPATAPLPAGFPAPALPPRDRSPTDDT